MARASIDTNAAAVASQMIAWAASAELRAEPIEDTYAQLGAQLMAAGAPRGEGTDGHYADTIQARGNEILVNKDYWARLEFGFIGTDSRGRNYAQAPQPHIRPVVEALREPFSTAVARAVIT